MIHLKVAFRNIKRKPLMTVISIAGLSMGFACFLLIIHYLRYENNFDTFHKDSSRIFRIIQYDHETDEIRKISSVGPQVGIQAKAQLPEVEDMSRIMVLGRFTLGNEIALRDYETIWVVDSGFFDFFTFPLLRGDGSTALNTPNSLLLSENLARKHFQGGLPELGDSIWTNVLVGQVSGVFGNIPKQSHLQFDLILPENVTAANFKWWNNFINTNWKDNSFNTYLKLAKDADPAVVADKLTSLARSHFPEDRRSLISFQLQPLTDIHFGDKGIEGSLASNTGNTFYVYLLSVLGFLVLIVAVFNYSNLSTAAALRRTKEIGLRKTVGAGKYQVIRQFIFESMVMSFLALLFALFITILIIPTFNQIMDVKISLDFFDINLWAIVIGIVLLTGVLASLYPAWVMSRVSPTDALKDSNSARTRGFSFRKVMVVGQFAVAILMITSTLIVRKQLHYMNTIDLGFDLDKLVVIDINSGQLRNNAEAIKDEMNAIPGIESSTVSSRVPGEWKDIPTVQVHMGSKATDQDMSYLGVDDNFLSTFHISLAAGSNFSGNDSDSTKVLLNEMAVKELNLADPVGKIIEIPSVNWNGDIQKLDKPFRATVIGVVADFYFESFKNRLKPMVLAYSNNPIHAIDYFTVRMQGRNIPEILDGLKDVNARFDPENPMEYHFLDTQFERFFTQDIQRGRVFMVFSIIVILISCMGLFALAAYEIRYRMKELGIRKVLGASVNQITIMLTKNFIWLVLIAFVISAPIGWWISSKWLEEFAYRMSLNGWILILPGLLALGLAIITVVFLTVRAARSNPAKIIYQE